MSMEIKNLLGIDLEQMPQYLQRAPDYASQQPEPEQKESAGSQIGGLALDVLRGIAHGYAPRTMGAIEQFVQQRELKKRIGGAPQIGTGTDRNMTYRALMQRADILESMGDVESADTMRQRALQFSPTPIFATSTFNAQAPDGSIVRRATSQTGEIMDFGNVSASPDTLANIQSARSAAGERERLENIRQTGRVQIEGVKAANKQSRPLSPSGPAVRTKPLSATEFKELAETEDVIGSSQSALSALDKALSINDQAYYGLTAKPRAVIESQIGGNPRANATIELDNLIQNQALASMKAIFGGNPTEGERRILLDLQASAEKTPQQRAEILKRARAATAARIEKSKRKASAIRSGEFGTPAYEQSQPAPAQPRKRYNPATGKIESY